MHFLIKQATNERACQLSKGGLATVLSLISDGDRLPELQGRKDKLQRTQRRG